MQISYSTLHASARHSSQLSDINFHSYPDLNCNWFITLYASLEDHMCHGRNNRGGAFTQHKARRDYDHQGGVALGRSPEPQLLYQAADHPRDGPLGLHVDAHSKANATGEASPQRLHLQAGRDVVPELVILTGCTQLC